jgi:catechol 2,3-dioxygenase-like lactoylglutathione lyase family enzyme
MEVLELNHVALFVRDLVASERFYGEVLDLPRLCRPDFSFPGAWFALGAQELHLIVEETMPPDERHHGHFALRVPDALAARREIELRGGAEDLRGPAPRPDGALQVFLRDPDGHLIELLQYVPVE